MAAPSPVVVAQPRLPKKKIHPCIQMHPQTFTVNAFCLFANGSCVKRIAVVIEKSKVSGMCKSESPGNYSPPIFRVPRLSQRKYPGSVTSFSIKPQPVRKKSTKPRLGFYFDLHYFFSFYFFSQLSPAWTPQVFFVLASVPVSWTRHHRKTSRGISSEFRHESSNYLKVFYISVWTDMDLNYNRSVKAVILEIFRQYDRVGKCISSKTKFGKQKKKDSSI